MTPQNILRAIKKIPVVEKLARDNDWHVYKIIQMSWNTKDLNPENMRVTKKTQIRGKKFIINTYEKRPSVRQSLATIDISFPENFIGC